MSYCPPPPFAISVTISSDEPAYLALTWQFVCCWKGCTQSFSVYPSQAIRFNCPSPAPIDVGGFMFAVGGCDCAGPPLEVDVPPHAANRRTSDSPSTAPRASRSLLKRSPMSFPPPSCVPTVPIVPLVASRCRRPGPAARRAGPGGRAARVASPPPASPAAAPDRPLPPVHRAGGPPPR